jgi:glutathione S-transferase
MKKSRTGGTIRMLKVYGRDNSVNVQKVMWVIGELGLDHERLDVGGQFGRTDEDWYLAMNPMGRVPVLDDDGFILFESHSIVRYLTCKYGDATLYPANARARADAEKWMDWHIAFQQPAIFHAFWGLIRTAEEDRDMAAIGNSAAESARLMGVLNQQLEKQAYIAADHLTIGDIPIGAMTYRWYGLEVEHPDYPALRDWYERLTTRQPFRDHVMLPIS